MRMLETHAPAIFYNPRDTYDVIFFILMLSRQFRPGFRQLTLIRYERVFVLIHFQERFQIDALLMRTLSVLVWTEDLNASKCMRFNKTN